MDVRDSRTRVDARASRGQRFEAYVVPEIPTLLRVAQRLTGQPADAEDLVQETLVRAYRAIDSFDGAHPRAWLLTILRRAEISRHRRRRPDLLETQQLERLAEPGAETPERSVMAATFDAEVDAALRQLPHNLYEVIHLVDLDGFCYTEAAEILGVPRGTVMSRLHRARKRIRSHLTRAGVAPRRRRS